MDVKHLFIGIPFERVDMTAGKERLAAEWPKGDGKFS